MDFLTRNIQGNSREMESGTGQKFRSTQRKEKYWAVNK